MTLELIIGASLLCTVFLTGLIWVVQVIHYPSFHFIKDDEFIRYVYYHADQISLVVAPVMIVELALGALWLFFNSSTNAIINITSIMSLWLITFFVSVPCHKKLTQGKEAMIIDRLIQTNWPRTIIWTARTIFLASLVIGASVKQ